MRGEDYCYGPGRTVADFLKQPVSRCFRIKKDGNLLIAVLFFVVDSKAVALQEILVIILVKF